MVIPNEIDGKPVVQIGMNGLGFSYSISYSSNFKNLYLPKSLKLMTYNLNKNFFIPYVPASYFYTNYREDKLMAIINYCSVLEKKTDMQQDVLSLSKRKLGE